MRLGRKLALGAMVLLLAACTNTATRETASPTDWPSHRDQLQGLQNWSFQGKLALRSETASESSSLRWQQRGHYAHLEMSGPLGVGNTIIDSDGHQMDIRRGGEYRTLDISSPAAVLSNTGWDLPLHALPHWLKGIPSPDLPIQSRELDPQTQLLTILRQDDWEIRYESYGKFQEILLPTRLRITRGTTRLKLLIRNWQDVSH